jgi:hypothetical protein
VVRRGANDIRGDSAALLRNRAQSTSSLRLDGEFEPCLVCRLRSGRMRRIRQRTDGLTFTLTAHLDSVLRAATASPIGSRAKLGTHSPHFGRQLPAATDLPPDAGNNRNHTRNAVKCHDQDYRDGQRIKDETHESAKKFQPCPPCPPKAPSTLGHFTRPPRPRWLDVVGHRHFAAVHAFGSRSWFVAGFPEPNLARQ